MISQSLNSKKGRGKAKNPLAFLTLLTILGSVASLPLATTTIQHASAQAIETTSIYIDPQSAIAGEQVTIRGFLLIPFNYPNINLAGQQINITLSDLEGNLPDVELDPVITENDFGDFFATFTTPSEAAYWNVTADFGGNTTLAASTGSAIFATTESEAIEFDVTNSSGVDILLTGFSINATVNIDPVPDDYLSDLTNTVPIPILVSQCTSPDSSAQSKYLPLSFDTVDNNDNICLEIFPSSLLQLDNEPIIHINMSYAGIEALPAGFSENNIDLFYYDPFTGELVEITESRDVGTQRITGTSYYTGRFIVGIGLHGEAAPGAVRQHVFVGDGQPVMFRDIADLTNATASIVAISPDEITLDEPVTVTLNYSNGNLDVGAVDELPVRINSTSSTPDFVTIEFTETAVNSGIFTGSLTLTGGATAGTFLHAAEDDVLSFNIPNRDLTDGRFKAILDGVSVPGVVELSDVELTETELNALVNNTGIVPVVGLVNMTLVDATLDNSGEVNVIMSYANALLGPQEDPSILRIYHKAPGQGWDTNLGNLPVVTVDETNLLVSTTYGISNPGLFALAFPTGNPGGAGGGLGKPGVGIVLDFLVPFAPSQPSGGGDGGSGNSGGGTGGSGSRVVIINQQMTAFSEGYFEENPLERVEVSSLTFFSATGTSILNGNVGQQISIGSTFTNQQQTPQSYAFIVVIADQDGYVVDIIWQEGVAASGQTVDVSTSWTPQSGGDYTVKIFVWDGFENPMPLSMPTSSNIGVD